MWETLTHRGYSVYLDWGTRISGLAIELSHCSEEGLNTDGSVFVECFQPRPDYYCTDISVLLPAWISLKVAPRRLTKHYTNFYYSLWSAKPLGDHRKCYHHYALNLLIIWHVLLNLLVYKSINYMYQQNNLQFCHVWAQIIGKTKISRSRIKAQKRHTKMTVLFPVIEANRIASFFCPVSYKTILFLRK